MNELYAVRMIEAQTLPSAQAWTRLSLVFDLIDFDSIRTICDIGSRFGENAIELQHIFPAAEVHAFEPVPANYAECLSNKIAFDKPNIEFHNVALGERTAMIPFYPVNDKGSEHNVGASSKYKFIPGLNGSFFGKTWLQDEITVPQRTLDSYGLPVDLIWMDAQGSELDVLRGAVETLKTVQVILTEVGVDSYYQGQSLKPEIDEFLAEQGFVELAGAQEYCHQYEINTIYVRSPKG